MTELAWTAADDARVASFEQQILAVARVAARAHVGHDDLFVVAFARALASLMREGLEHDARRGPRYLRVLKRLVEDVCLTDAADEVTH